MLLVSGGSAGSLRASRNRVPAGSACRRFGRRAAFKLQLARGGAARGLGLRAWPPAVGFAAARGLGDPPHHPQRAPSRAVLRLLSVAGAEVQHWPRCRVWQAVTVPLPRAAGGREQRKPKPPRRQRASASLNGTRFWSESAADTGACTHACE
jgi:hypothetical protein